MRKIIIVLLLIIGTNNFLSAQTYNIIDFGAKTDTLIINTNAIQKAIDKCYADGGGEVIVPAGKFYTGTIFLKSKVILRLMSGAILQGSYNPSDYIDHNILAAKKFGTITHNGLYLETMSALVIADKAQHVGIVGEGTLRGAGDGKSFQLGINKDGKPKNIFFIGCTDVVLKGIKVLNSAQVTVSISGCERVNIDGIFLESLTNWNCDGLDIDAKDVVISNCIINSEDDAICFKSEYLDKFCENITVTNCVVSSLCNGIKLGTGSRTGFRNITVNNCVIKKSPINGYRHWKMTPDVVFKPEEQTVLTGIVILGVDGGLVENIHFSNIIMTDVISPFFIRVGKRFLNPNNQPSIMRNISIDNVRAETRSILPSMISGLEESWAEEISLSNIHIKIPLGVDKDSLSNYPEKVYENIQSYPENRLTFGLKLPANAFYIKHVRGLTFNDISISYQDRDLRPAFYFEEVEDVRLKSVLVDNKTLKLKDKSMLINDNSKNIKVND